jgi:hypothetical protein
MLSPSVTHLLITEQNFVHLTSANYGYNTPEQRLKGGVLMNRPVGVTVIAVLEFIAAAFCVLVGLAFMLGGGLLATIMSQSGAQGSAAGAGILGAVGAAAGVFVLVFGALYILTGWGMLKLRGWARIVTLVLAGLAILGSLLGLAGAFVHFSVFALFWIAVRVAIAGWMMWYLLQPNVSAAFNVGQARTASA